MTECPKTVWACLPCQARHYRETTSAMIDFLRGDGTDLERVEEVFLGVAKPRFRWWNSLSRSLGYPENRDFDLYIERVGLDCEKIRENYNKYSGQHYRDVNSDPRLLDPCQGSQK